MVYEDIEAIEYMDLEQIHVRVLYACREDCLLTRYCLACKVLLNTEVRLTLEAFTGKSLDHRIMAFLVEQVMPSVNPYSFYTLYQTI